TMTTALNGGPMFTFSPAISFFVNCETQEEVDRLWEKLCAGGEKQRCGWLKDKYGVSWQIVPTVLGQMLQDKDAEKSKRVMNAMMQMDKGDGPRPSSRATRDLRKISPVGRNDNSLSLRAWRLGAITGCAMQVNFLVCRDQPIFVNDDDAV